MPAPYKARGIADGRVMAEHRWLMEQKLGRKLTRFELVHHINGDKRDNRIENLEVVSHAEHAERHGQWKHSPVKTCEVCGKQFTPVATKRAIAKTCSKQCRYDLTAKTNARPDKPRSKYREDAPPSVVSTRRISMPKRRAPSSKP
jgi:hypothetical protein